MLLLSCVLVFTHFLNFASTRGQNDSFLYFPSFVFPGRVSRILRIPSQLPRNSPPPLLFGLFRSVDGIIRICECVFGDGRASLPPCFFFPLGRGFGIRGFSFSLKSGLKRPFITRFTSVGKVPGAHSHADTMGG